MTPPTNDGQMTYENFINHIVATMAKTNYQWRFTLLSRRTDANQCHVMVENTERLYQIRWDGDWFATLIRTRENEAPDEHFEMEACPYMTALLRGYKRDDAGNAVVN